LLASGGQRGLESCDGASRDLVGVDNVASPPSAERKERFALTPFPMAGFAAAA